MKVKYDQVNLHRNAHEWYEPVDDYSEKEKR